MNFQELTELLAQHRRLLLRGEVDDGGQMVLSTALTLLDLQGHDPIRLEIDSGGGSADAALYLGDTIQSIRSPVHGVVVGFAGSAAFDLLQMCDVRIARPNATVLFHGGYSKIYWDNQEATYVRGKYLYERGLRKTAARSGQPLRRVRAWSREDRKFSAHEALALGFIDRIEHPTTKTGKTM